MALSVKNLREMYTECKLDRMDELISMKMECIIDHNLSELYSWDHINQTEIYARAGYIIIVPISMETPTVYSMIMSNLLNIYRNKGWEITFENDLIENWTMKLDISYDRDTTINKLLETIDPNKIIESSPRMVKEDFSDVKVRDN